MVIDFTNFIEKVKDELFYRKEDTFNLKIRNPDNLSKLKHIKSVILDKNQTITDNQLTISGLVIENELYEINDNEILLIRDILSQAKNEKPPRHHESVREIPEEDNDVISKLHYNMTVNRSSMVTDESNRGLLTELTKPDLTRIPDFNMIDDVEVPPNIIREKETSFTEPPLIDRNRENKFVKHNLSEIKIGSNNNPARINSLQASVFVDPYIENEKSHPSNIFRPKLFKQLCEEKFYDINDILYTLILCHFTRTKVDLKNNSFTHESIHPEIASILEFCDKFGYSFKGSYKIADQKIPIYETNTCSQSEYHPIIGFNEMTKNRTRFSLIVGRPLEKSFEIVPNQATTLYVHGDDADQMIGILNLSSKDKENLRNKIEKLRETGQRTLIYAKKELTAEETKKYIKRKKIIKTSLTIKEDELEGLYNSIEEKLDLICVVCLKEKLRPHVMSTIKTFNDAHLKLYFVSADNECSTLASAFQAGIINKEVEIYKIQVNTQNAALLSVKWILEKIRNHLSTFKRSGMEDQSPSKMSESLKNDLSGKRVLFDEGSNKRGVFGIKTENSFDEVKGLCILIDGESFEIIYKNKYLRNHFLFLMLFCSNVCFNFTALDKKRLAKLIKRLDSSDTNYVLGIGDGYDDLQMLQECDLSIELKTPDGETVAFKGDFIVDDFKKISDLIFRRGNELFMKNEDIMLYMFCVFWTLLINLFYLSWFTDFTGVRLINSINFDVLTVIMSVQIILVYFLFEGKTIPFLTGFLPLLYKNDGRNKVIEFKRLYLKTFIPALLDSTIVFFFCYCSPGYLDGNIDSYEQRNMIMNISYFFVFSIKVK